MNTLPRWLWIAGGLVLIIALTATGGSIAMASWMTSYNAQKWAAALGSAENRYGIPQGLLSRIAYQESHFIQDIIDGTRASSAGALGMMQLMPRFFATVRRPVPFSDQDTLDQIDEAAQELARLYGHFGDWTSAVAAYNAGQGTIDRVLAGTATLPNQTADYIAEVSSDLPGLVNPSLTA